MFINRPLERRLPLALAILRVTTGLFFLLWAVEKLVRPESNVGIWESFYGIEIGLNFSYINGVFNTLLALAMIVGLWRTITYGLWTVFHTISVASTWEQLVHPYTGGNHLFLAGVPIVALMVALFLLRDQDTWSLDGRRQAARPSAGAPTPGETPPPAGGSTRGTEPMP